MLTLSDDQAQRLHQLLDGHLPLGEALQLRDELGELLDWRTRATTAARQMARHERQQETARLTKALHLAIQLREALASGKPGLTPDKAVHLGSILAHALDAAVSTWRTICAHVDPPSKPDRERPKLEIDP